MVLQTGNIEDGDLRNNVVRVGSVPGFANEFQGIGTAHWHTFTMSPEAVPRRDLSWTTLCNGDLCP